MTSLLVPCARWVRWVDNFERRHGPGTAAVICGRLVVVAQDGSRVEAGLPFGAEYAGPPDVGEFAEAARAAVPADWGVLLVRKGGFAIARLSGATLVQHKIGQRHVQGRAKAGGQSQQRFARRRENQARQAYDAAGNHAVRILGVSTAGAARLPVVVGGDRAAVDVVLSDPRLAHLVPTPPWLPVAEPRRKVLDAAIEDARAVAISVDNR